MSKMDLQIKPMLTVFISPPLGLESTPAPPCLLPFGTTTDEYASYKKKTKSFSIPTFKPEEAFRRRQ